MIVRRLPNPDSELYHHGIMGMKWGVRRFQNRDGTLTSAGRKHKGLVDQIRDNRRMKKVRKAKVEKAKERQRLKEEQTKRLQKAAAERKERAEVIKTGNAKDIQKFQHKMSDKEYETALQRVKYNQLLSDFSAQQSRAKMEKLQDRLNTVMGVARTVGDIANSAASVYSSLEKIGVVKRPEKETPLEKLRNKKERMGLELDIKDLQFQDSMINKANKINKLQSKKDRLALERDISDLKYERKMQKQTKRPDELEILKRESELSKYAADIEKNNRIIEGRDQKSLSDYSMDDILKEIAKRS